MVLRDFAEALAIDRGWMTKDEIKEARRAAERERIREFMRKRHAAKKAAKAAKPVE